MNAPKPPRLTTPVSPAWTVATLLTAASFAVQIWYIALRTPEAQAAAGGLAQKIFYFHVPAATSFYLAAGACFLASCVYLVRPSQRSDAWAKAGAECAAVFGAMVLTSGPLWAKKAWGVYWTWDPRLTTLLLAVLLYVALVLLRRFSGEGNAERRFAAAFGVLSATLLPIVHYAVKLWGGNHPVVIGGGGGGLSSPAMKIALSLGFCNMTALAVLLLLSRARLAELDSRLREAEELAYGIGLLGADDSPSPSAQDRT